MENAIEVTTGVGRILVGALLLLAGIAKMRNGLNAFQQVVLGYELVPRRLVPLLSKALPVVEVVVGTLLVLGLFVNLAATAAFGLVFVFSAVIAISLLRGRKHQCGCVGLASSTVQQIQWRLVYRNLSVLAVLVAAAATRPRLTLGNEAMSSLAERLPQAPQSVFLYVLIGSFVCAVIAHLYSRQVPSALEQHVRYH